MMAFGFYIIIFLITILKIIIIAIIARGRSSNCWSPGQADFDCINEVKSSAHRYHHELSLRYESSSPTYKDLSSSSFEVFESVIWESVSSDQVFTFSVYKGNIALY